MKKIGLLCIIAMLGIAMILYVFKPNDQQSTNNILYKETNNDQQSVADHVGNQQQTSKLLPHLENQDLQIFKPIAQNEIERLNIPDIFQHTENGFLFDFDHHLLAEKKPGDHLQMQMLKFGINRKAMINNVELLDDDIVKWSGTFEGYPADINYFTITQTQKDAYAVMKIFTNNGAYVAEIKNGIGLALPLSADLDHDEVHVH